MRPVRLGSYAISFCSCYIVDGMLSALQFLGRAARSRSPSLPPRVGVLSVIASLWSHAELKSVAAAQFEREVRKNHDTKGTHKRALVRQIGRAGEAAVSV